jgi:hypothetical protein
MTVQIISLNVFVSPLMVPGMRFGMRRTLDLCGDLVQEIHIVPSAKSLISTLDWSRRSRIGVIIADLGRQKHVC